jgi:hypothetical protein
MDQLVSATGSGETAAALMAKGDADGNGKLSRGEASALREAAEEKGDDGVADILEGLLNSNDLFGDLAPATPAPATIKPKFDPKATDEQQIRVQNVFDEMAKAEKGPSGDLGLDEDDLVKEMFAELDMDRDKYVDVGELPQLFKKLGFKDKDGDGYSKYVNRYMKKYDVNNDKRLDFSEFAKVYNSLAKQAAKKSKKRGKRKADKLKRKQSTEEVL